MPEQKRTINVLGKDTEVVDVPIVKMHEPSGEYELEDGTVLRVRNAASAILRIEGQSNADGTPLYFVMTTPVVTVISSRTAKR